MPRDRGTGSIYQDSTGRWRATIEAGWTARGTRRRLKITAATKTEAQTKLRAALRRIAESGMPAPGSASITVKRWAEDWHRRQADTLRPKTMVRTNTAIHRWIIPTIGHRRLGALTPGDIRAVAAAITGAGRSSATAHRIHAVLIKMLRDAVLEGHTVPPRVLLVPAPPDPPSDRQGPSVEEATALLRVAAGDPDASRWVAALLQGMRQGECLGLTWECIDLDRGTIDVSWQLQDLPYQHGCGGACGYARGGSCPQRRFRTPLGYEVRPIHGAWCLVRPKTARGRRIIPIVLWMEQALARHSDAMRRDDGTLSGLVWSVPGARPRLPRADTAAWRDLQARAGVAHPSGRPYLVHEARHSTATLLMRGGVPESVRIAILGHATVASTRAYEHADLAQARAALEAAAGRLGLT